MATGVSDEVQIQYPPRSEGARRAPSEQEAPQRCRLGHLPGGGIHCPSRTGGVVRDRTDLRGPSWVVPRGRGKNGERLQAAGGAGRGRVRSGLSPGSQRPARFDLLGH